MRCPACQTVSVGAFPAEAPSRAQYGPRLRALAVYLVEQQLVPYGRVREMLADLFGASLSLGTLVAWVQQAATILEPVEAQIKAALLRARCCIAMRRGCGKRTLAWAHVASTHRLTHYAVHPKRGTEATTDIGILPAYTGVSVHDGWKPYRAHTQCRHALCNIHHLRELTYLEELYGQTWAKELKDLLREMKAVTGQARAAGTLRLAQQERDAFVARYEEILAAGHAANPPPARPAHHKGGSNNRPPATSWNGSGWGKRRCSPSSTTCPFLLTTTRRKEIFGCLKSSRRCPAASVLPAVTPRSPA